MMKKYVGITVLASILILAACVGEATPEYDYKNLIGDLGSSGAHVEDSTGFSVAGRSVAVNGGTIQVYEFPDDRAADTEAGYVTPDGYNITVPLDGDRTKTVHSDWLAPPHYYKKDRVIVLYVGADQSLIEVLQSLLGREFAGPGAPTPMPASTPIPRNVTTR